jgi:hypothetical protein
MNWLTIIAWLVAHWAAILALFGIGIGLPMAAGVNPVTWVKAQFAGSAAPTRDDAVKAYDVLKVYAGSKPTLAEKLKGIWGELE